MNKNCNNISDDPVGLPLYGRLPDPKLTNENKDDKDKLLPEQIVSLASNIWDSYDKEIIQLRKSKDPLSRVHFSTLIGMENGVYYKHKYESLLYYLYNAKMKNVENKFQSQLPVTFKKAFEKSKDTENKNDKQRDDSNSIVKVSDKLPPFPTFLSPKDLMLLKVGDNIDYRDERGIYHNYTIVDIDTVKKTFTLYSKNYPLTNLETKFNIHYLDLIYRIFPCHSVSHRVTKNPRMIHYMNMHYIHQQ